jgi:hypothetical protein
VVGRNLTAFSEVGTAGSAGRMGLGIRIEDDLFYRSMCFCSRPYH